MSRTLSFIACAVVLALGAAAFASSNTRYVTDCSKAKVRPGSITITCGDANAAVIDLHWSSWGGSEAHATGKFAYNDCKPSCAGGSGRTTPASVTLKGRTVCHGRSHYHEMIVHFTAHHVPSGYKRYSPFLLGCPLG